LSICETNSRMAFEKRHGRAGLPSCLSLCAPAIQSLCSNIRIVNSSLEGRQHPLPPSTFNAGIAVAPLDWGLIVPVLKNADELNFPRTAAVASPTSASAPVRRGSMPADIEGANLQPSPTPGQFWRRLRACPSSTSRTSAIMGVGGYHQAALGDHRQRWHGFPSQFVPSYHLTAGLRPSRRRRAAVADQFMARGKGRPLEELE